MRPWSPVVVITLLLASMLAALTVAFTSEFLGSAREGDYMEARGEVLRAGGSLIFVRGVVTAEGKPCLNFSGTIKRLRER